MSMVDGWPVGEALEAFDEHLRRARGLAPGTRRNYARYVKEFLSGVFPSGRVDVDRIGVGDVIAFVGSATLRYQPRTVELVATSLRSFFRFLRAAGLRGDRSEDWVPMVPHRRSGLVRHLAPRSFEQLIGSLESLSPRDMRDRAIILCSARLGLRAGEVVQLLLDDIDWANAVVTVRARKTGHGARLPLPVEVGAAIADYLQHARPDTDVREVFVLHWLHEGAPISTSVVARAVDRALRRAGIPSSARGSNLLRHSLATELLDRGAGLREIADLFGHRELATTRIYASVDIGALRQVALPWPQVMS